MPLAHAAKASASARATTPPPQVRARATTSPATVRDGDSSAARAASVAASGSVNDKIAAAQRRRAERERSGESERAPKQGVGVGALAAAQKAAEREAEWRAGRQDRAAEVRAMRMQQLAEVEAEDAAARARAEGARREAEAREAEARAAAARAAAAAEARAQAEAKRQAEEEANDPFQVIWGNTQPAAAARGGALGSNRGRSPAAARPASPRPLTSASHAPGASIENGNTLGTRPVVRQSKLYRQHDSGNAMKAAMGHDALTWDTERLQVRYALLAPRRIGAAHWSGAFERRIRAALPALAHECCGAGAHHSAAPRAEVVAPPYVCGRAA